MSTRYVGAIDQGTSSTRFVVFDQAGKPVASAQTPIRNHYPQAGWVEHDPMELLSSVHSCVAEVCKKVPPGSIQAVGITNQRETTVVWDKLTGKPLHKAIVWLDTRTRDLVNALIKKHGSADVFRPLVGLPISTYFSGLKLKWLLGNVPAIQQAVTKGTALFGTVDSWLLWNLTGGVQGGRHYTDVSNASRTMLMNISSCEWEPSICKELGVPLSMLPAIKSNSEVYGQVCEGPLQGVAISGCLGDQHAALVGQMCFKPGQAKNTYGTGCFMLLNTGTAPIQSRHGLLTTIGYQLGKNGRVHYALEGSIAVAGVGMSWLQDNLQVLKSPTEIDALIATTKGNDGVYIVPAFSGLLSPYWRSDARAVIVGLTLQSTRAHLVRGMLESTVYQTRDVLTAMMGDVDDAKVPLQLHELRVDGGLTRSEFMLQFQADQLKIDVLRPTMIEATAAGAAYAAGLAVGFWKSLEDIEHKCFVNADVTRFRPAHNDPSDLNYRGWSRALKKSLDLAVEPPPASKL